MFAILQLLSFAINVGALTNGMVIKLRWEMVRIAGTISGRSSYIHVCAYIFMFPKWGTDLNEKPQILNF